MREQMEGASRRSGVRDMPSDDGPPWDLHSKTSTRPENGGLSNIDGVSAIDASGALPDGTKFSGPAVGLRKLLLGRSDQCMNR